MPSLDDAMAEFVARTRFQDLPAHTVEITKRSLLDALGVTLAASALGEGCAAFVQLARATGGGTPESTLLGFGDKVSAPAAALANGAMAHALDYEDAYDGAPLHPNAPVIAAVLAEAEALGGVSGQAFLTAIAVGCDVTCRLGLSIKTDMTEAGWYPPPIFGAFGATAAVANLRGLSARQILDAFSLTLCQATCSAEIKYSPDSAIRAVRDAFPAQAGVLSARLAQNGVRGYDEPLGGKAGFFQLYGRGAFDPDEVVADLGRRFHGERVSFKLWPSCRGTHPFVEAALALQAAHPFEADEIEEIRLIGAPLHTMLMEPREQKLAPQSPINAKFSLPFTLGTVLANRRVTLDEFVPARLRDEGVLKLAKRVTLEVAPGWGNERGASGSLELRLTDGRRLRHDVDLALGHPDHPVDRSALVTKFKDCAARAAHPLSAQEADRWVEAVFTLDEAADAARSILVSPQLVSAA